MRRPILHYSIVRQYFHGHRIVAVVTENRTRWWGRVVISDEPTTGALRDILTRHATLAEAESRLSVVRSVDQHFGKIRQMLCSFETQAHRRADRALQLALGGNTPELPVLRLSWDDDQCTP